VTPWTALSEGLSALRLGCTVRSAGPPIPRERGFPCSHAELRDRVASTNPRKSRTATPTISGAEIQTRMSIVRQRTIAHG
jgi:hypothetical protein